MNESGSWLWWGKNVLMGIFSSLFLILGIETMMTAYSLHNPLEFIMYFFSASLIILISLVGMIYPAFRIHTFFKSWKNK
jgi:Ni,Fe-hydrogenase I cytochrome b subunit